MSVRKLCMTKFCIAELCTKTLQKNFVSLPRWAFDQPVHSLTEKVWNFQVKTFNCLLLFSLAWLNRSDDQSLIIEILSINLFHTKLCVSKCVAWCITRSYIARHCRASKFEFTVRQSGANRQNLLADPNWIIYFSLQLEDWKTRSERLASN